MQLIVQLHTDANQVEGQEMDSPPTLHHIQFVAFLFLFGL